MLGYLPHLEKTMRQLLLNLYHSKKGNLRHHLSLELYCTDTDSAGVDQLQAALAGTILEDKVVFSRPRLEHCIREVMTHQLVNTCGAAASARLSRLYTLVTYCGSPGVAKRCALGCQRANELAGSMGYTGHLVHFRNEFYGLVAGGGGTKRQTVRAEDSPKAARENGPASDAVRLSMSDAVRLSMSLESGSPDRFCLLDSFADAWDDEVLDFISNPPGNDPTPTPTDSELARAF